MTKKLVSFDDQAEPGQGLPAAVKAELNNTYVGARKKIAQAKFPEPIRQPVFVVDREFPQRGVDYMPIWRDGDTVYAQSLKPVDFLQGPQLMKSTDGGGMWSARGLLPNPITGGRFLRLRSGTLLSGGSTAVPRIHRSANDGTSWSLVYQMRPETMFLGMQSWAEDEVTGHVYATEYYYSYNGIGTQSYPTLRILRSTDDGATWSTFHEFPSTHTGGAGHIDHIHSAQWDPISQRVYFATGDKNPSAGIYRVNSAGTGVEPVILNSQSGGDSARAIGLMFFPTHIAWASDSSEGAIYRLARSEIGTPTPNVETVISLGATGYYSARASSDGSRWLTATTPEHTSSVDNVVHLWSVEDNGSTVFEVASFPHRRAQGVQVTLGPVGQPGYHGNEVWLQSVQSDYEWAVSGRIAYGSAPHRRPTPARVEYPPAALPPVPRAGFTSMPVWIGTQAAQVPLSKFMGAGFRAEKSGTITQVAARSITGTKPGGGDGSTLARVGVYQMHQNGTLILLGSSPNLRSALAVGNTTTTFTLSAPVELVAGELYCFGIVVHEPEVQPSVLGWSMAGIGVPPWMSQPPLFAVSAPGVHADLPASGIAYQGATVAPMLYGT